MIMLAVLLLALSPAATLVATDRVELEAREVRLGDVAAWQGPDGLGSIVIARLAEGRPAVRLSREELTNLIRQRVPAIHVGAAASGSILLVAPARAVSPKEHCLELVMAKAAGEELLAGDVVSAPCPEAMPEPALRFDRVTRAHVVPHALDAGAVIPFARLIEAPALRRGDRLTLASKVGPVTIERPVTLAQGARPFDRKIFVRTNDGEILAARIRDAGDPSK